MHLQHLVVASHCPISMGASPTISWTLLGLVACALVFSVGAPLAQGGGDQRECDLTVTGQIPLPDAGGLFYRRVGMNSEYATTPSGPEWRQVGLYGSGSTTRPNPHEAAGISIAESIVPIDGKVVLLSIGMSNTRQEFGRFRFRTLFEPSVDPDVVVVNGAQGGLPLDAWTSPSDDAWDRVDAALAEEGLTPDQVQVAWVKHAVRSPMHPPLDFPTHPETVQLFWEDMIRALKTRYPNVILTYLSSRTRAYNTNQAAQSPEPAAYEGGFAVQWTVEKQLAGDPGLRYDGVDPPAPWLSWGPYLWTDGTGAPEGDPASPFEARSDGFIWTCADVQEDGVHPSPPTPDPNEAQGEFKIGDQLMAFFLTDPTSVPWFLRSTTGGTIISSILANGEEVLDGSITGPAPFQLDLSLTTDGPVAGHAWTYDDGTFSFLVDGTTDANPPFEDNSTPSKIFHVPGTYGARVAVRDGNGNTTIGTFDVVVDGETSSTNFPTDLPTDPAANPQPLSKQSMGLSAEPNPFGTSVTLRFDLPASAATRAEVFDAMGRLLTRKNLGVLPAGPSSLGWAIGQGLQYPRKLNQQSTAGHSSAGPETRSAPGGTYFVRISTRGQSETIRIVQLP